MNTDTRWSKSSPTLDLDHLVSGGEKAIWLSTYQSISIYLFFHRFLLNYWECIYLDVNRLCLSGTKQFAASIATLINCPVARHPDFW